MYDLTSFTSFVCIFSFLRRVNALAWDAELSILYLGGSFHAVSGVPISSGLAMWSKRTGLIDFPGGGVQHSDGGVGNTQVKAIAYEPKSEVRCTVNCWQGVMERGIA